MARWLRHWLRLAEPHLRPSALNRYSDVIDRYLIPSLGWITLADLTSGRLQACFELDRHARAGFDKPAPPRP